MATVSPGPLATVSPGPLVTVSPGPLNTVSPGPSATVSSGPLNTVFPGPSATVSPGSLNTVSPGPLATISSGPSATVAPGLSATVSPGPLNAVSPGPLATVSHGLLNTVSSAVAGPLKTVISPNPIVPTSSFYQKGGRTRGGISKYLSSPQGATPASTKALPRARLLTSSDVLAEMVEKEKKKKLALEEKARRKTEREVKRKQREEEQKRKAEERQKKAEERAKRVKEAANKKTRLKRAAEGGQRKLRSSGKAESESSSKKIRLQVPESDSTVDTNMCCVCYVLYSEDVSGAEWIGVDVDAGSTRSVQKIVMSMIMEKKDFVLLVYDFIHFYYVIICYIQLLCIRKRFFKHNAYRRIAIFVLNSVVCVI